MVDDHTAQAPYDTPLHATVTSTTGVALKAFEADINREVAALGSSRNQGLRWAIVRAIAPTLTKGDLPSGETPYVKESGRGVDWVITDRETDRALAIVEHKPLGAPAHGTWASHRLLFNTTAVICDAGYLQELTAHLNVLDRLFSEDEVVGPLRHYSYKIEKSGKRQSSLDQVLKYYDDFGGRLPVHILSDQGKDVNEIYGTPGQPYRYNTERFPVHATATALNTLAVELSGIALTPAELCAVTRVVDAMWMRGPTHIDNDLIDEAKALVSPAARYAGYNTDVWASAT